MSIKILNGATFAEMVKNGATNLNLNKKIVNELNVFPVPDGDTGDNMSMTIDSIYNNHEISNPSAIEKSADLIAHEVLLGARGNSGVILSRIFAGIAEGMKGKVEVSVADFDYAMKCGVHEAYEAVAKPVEGTILTVLKDSVNFAGREINEKTSFEEYFDILTKEMRNSIDRTPELLPSLKEAGVVDSGGVGLLYIFAGMYDFLCGKNLIREEDKKESSEDLDISLFTEDSELEFGYCTEFLLRLQNKKIKKDHFELEDFIDFLKSVGDSVVAFQNESIIKAHVHTKTPGEILNYCQKFGEFLKLKVENMTLQHNGAIIRNDYQNFKTTPHKKYGIIAVASGRGVIKTFEELGCDVVISGGQSMNPSTNDFLEAFEKIDAETIFVFPNNKNIIMAAEQAAQNFKNAKIEVIKTKTIGEGYAAISMFDAGTENIDEIIASLNEAIQNVVTGQVSQASKSTVMNGVKVVKNDFIGFSDGKIFTDQKNREKAVLELAEKLKVEKFDILIVFFGKEVSEKDAKELEKKLKEQYNRTEIFLIDGGQPTYDYILILE